MTLGEKDTNEDVLNDLRFILDKLVEADEEQMDEKGLELKAELLRLLESRGWRKVQAADWNGVECALVLRCELHGVDEDTCAVLRIVRRALRSASTGEGRVTLDPDEAEEVPDKKVWKGCGHRVKAVILDNNPLSVASHLEYLENNPRDLCLECWQKAGKGGGP
jgi:hypothetical protein